MIDRFPTSTLEARRARVATALALGDEVLVVGAGEPVGIPGGMDQTYAFLSHSEYFWLTDRETAGGVLAFDPGDGWTDFVPEVTEHDRIWEGRAENEAGAVPLGDFAGWLAARRGRGVVNLGSPIPGVRSDSARVAALREIFTHARRPKDAHEVARVREAVRATAEGYARLREVLRPGRTEREIQIEMEAAFFRAGADRPAYGTIVGTGPNSAVFHFTPSCRAAGEGEVTLVDAGAEIRRYGCDVTRTYPVSGRWTSVQRDLYAIVHRAEERAVAACAPGIETVDVHFGACRDVTEGLVAFGLLRGSVDSLIEREAHFLFFPHGIGHLVGLGVRDASGALPGRPKRTQPALKNQRTDFPLEPGYLMTIEPGVYFIPGIVNDPKRRERFADCVDWKLAESLLSLGGIRVEDNVLVTAGGRENLTEGIPKHPVD